MFRRIPILLACLLLVGACSAQDAAPYTDGLQYVATDTPQRYANDGKVEVVEVFSYGCIHCAQFAAHAEKLRKALPPGVSFHLVPADFSDEWEPYARAYYAAEQLGVAGKTHLELFREKFELNYPLNSLDDLAVFYAAHGVDQQAFMRAATSPATDARMARDLRLIQGWGVDATPTLVVDGKYRSYKVRSLDELVAVTQWLVQRELKAKGG